METVLWLFRLTLETNITLERFVILHARPGKPIKTVQHVDAGRKIKLDGKKVIPPFQIHLATEKCFKATKNIIIAGQIPLRWNC